jgi:CRP-like cAMP-binding protein
LDEAGQNLKALHDLLCSISAIPDEEWAWLRPKVQRREYGPRCALFVPGEVDSGLHFIVTGLVRYYYSTPEGLERNHTFAPEWSLVACLPAFVSGDSCPFTVEALEPTTTLLIPSETIRAFDQRHECWVRLKLRLMEYAALRKAEREAELLLETAQARYLRFRSEFPTLEHRIPQYHIASYLGITPVALSRIRRRIRS